MEEAQAHVVIVPTPGMGHLIPLVELAKRLVNLPTHRFTFSFIIPTQGPATEAQRAAVGSLPSGRAECYFLPPVSMDDLPPDAKIETKIALTLARSLPALRARLRTLSRAQVLVVDLFGTDAFELCPEFGLRPYIFYPTTAMCLSFFFQLPQLDSQVSCEFKELVEPVEVPGCVPVRGKDLLDPVQERKNDAYKWVLHHAKRYRLAEGILVNSFMELEKEAIEALQKPEPGKPPVYPVGPLVQTGLSKGVEGCECLEWLDEQPSGSVLYVSFGSGGTLSHEQLIELAHGLEMSGLRFLWVVRSPNDKAANATYFSTSQGGMDPLDYLPKGFLERTKGRGLAIPTWAPQIKVLSHESTGGFLTHCGWNSILEAVVHGVPLIAWPLYAEQKMNAVMLTEGLKVAVKPTANETGLVCRGDIATMVRGLMEGEEGKEIRSKMKDLKDAASRVLSEEGSSTKALCEVAHKWISH
uniref:Glycosyltransferase n=3 Tax=Opuntia streptacantha TaxID=393608 RepID=A0A7C9ELQ7_OPUST